MKDILKYQKIQLQGFLDELALTNKYFELSPFLKEKQVQIAKQVPRFRNFRHKNKQSPFSLFAQASASFCKWAKDNFDKFEDIVKKKPLKNSILKKIVTNCKSPSFLHQFYTSSLPELRCLVDDSVYLKFMQSYEEQFYSLVWNKRYLLPQEIPVTTLYKISEREKILALLVFKKMEEKLIESKTVMNKIPSSLKKKIFDYLLQLNCSFGPLTEYETTAPSHKLLLPTDFQRPTSGPAVVSPHEFLFNFDSFTQGLFRDFLFQLTNIPFF